jgi:hypothetical protein
VKNIENIMKNIVILCLILSISLFSIYSIDRITAENPADAANIIIGISSIDSNSCSECMIGGEYFESGCKKCIQDNISFRIKTAQNQPIITNWSNNEGMLYGDEKCSGQEIMPNISVKDNQKFWIEMHKKDSEYKLTLFEDETFSNEITSISNFMCSELENLKFLRISMNDGKPMANGGKIIGSIDNIEIYDSAKKNSDHDNFEFNNSYKNFDLVLSENFSDCQTKTCNDKWILQNPNRLFINTDNNNFEFNSEITGTNDYAHYEFTKYIKNDEWLMKLQLEIQQLDEHPHGKGILNIDPVFRVIILGFAIVLSILTIIFFLKIRMN